MVEHLVCNQGVVGSNPVASTILRRRFGRRDRGKPENAGRTALELRAHGEFFDNRWIAKRWQPRVHKRACG